MTVRRRGKRKDDANQEGAKSPRRTRATEKGPRRLGCGRAVGVAVADRRSGFHGVGDFARLCGEPVVVEDAGAIP